MQTQGAPYLCSGIIPSVPVVKMQMVRPIQGTLSALEFAYDFTPVPPLQYIMPKQKKKVREGTDYKVPNRRTNRKHLPRS
jgi:hypothetical protein